MTVPSAPSYDLSLASDITRRIHRPVLSAHGVVAPAKDEDAYIRFDLARFVDTASPAPPMVVEEDADDASGLEPQFADLDWEAIAGSNGWRRLLAWAIDGVGASGAFVVDLRGLVIALEGHLEQQETDERAPRLLMAIEHATHLRPDATGAFSVSVELGNSWLTGLWVEASLEEPLVVGIEAVVPLSTIRRRRIQAAFARKLREG